MSQEIYQWEGKIFEDGSFIIADGPVDDLTSCVVASRNAHPEPEVGRANARLLLAAPKLLEALQACMGHMEALERMHDYELPEAEEARQAIELAKSAPA